MEQGGKGERRGEERRGEDRRREDREERGQVEKGGTGDGRNHVRLEIISTTQVTL